jgi:hypothetical protein
LQATTPLDTNVLAIKPPKPQSSSGKERLIETRRQILKSDEEKQENKIQNKEKNIEKQRAVKGRQRKQD